MDHVLHSLTCTWHTRLQLIFNLPPPFPQKVPLGTDKYIRTLYITRWTYMHHWNFTLVGILRYQFYSPKLPLMSFPPFSLHFSLPQTKKTLIQNIQRQQCKIQQILKNLVKCQKHPNYMNNYLKLTEYRRELLTKDVHNFHRKTRATSA